jgi:hypothetical protein
MHAMIAVSERRAPSAGSAVRSAAKSEQVISYFAAFGASWSSIGFPSGSSI